MRTITINPAVGYRRLRRRTKPRTSPTMRSSRVGTTGSLRQSSPQLRRLPRNGVQDRGLVYLSLGATRDLRLNSPGRRFASARVRKISLPIQAPPFVPARTRNIKKSPELNSSNPLEYDDPFFACHFIRQHDRACTQEHAMSDLIGSTSVLGTLVRAARLEEE